MKKEIKGLFKFRKSKEYPNGAVEISKDSALKLQELGWKVSFHTDYYYNFIGGEFKGLQIGFGAWDENLEISISSPEVGYYSDSWCEPIKVNSQKDLDKLVEFIHNMVELSKIL